MIRAGTRPREGIWDGSPARPPRRRQGRVRFGDDNRDSPSPPPPRRSREGDRPCDRARRPPVADPHRAGIGRREKAVLLRRLIDRLRDGAGLRSNGEVAGIDLQDLVHPRQAQHDRTRRGHAAATLVPEPRHDRTTTRAIACTRRRVGRSRKDHRRWLFRRPVPSNYTERFLLDQHAGPSDNLPQLAEDLSAWRDLIDQCDSRATPWPRQPTRKSRSAPSWAWLTCSM